MKKLLIIDKHQFGYLTDSYKWCQYLKDEYEVTYLGFDGSNEKIFIPDVKVKYVSDKGNVIIRGIRFILYAIFSIFLFKGKIIVVYFEHCGIFKRLFPWKKMLLDVRTLSVSTDKVIREKYDNDIRNTCKLFDYITVISEGVKVKLSLPEKHISILPLGADQISKTTKIYNQMSLLYVGTLAGREIDKTIKGVQIFHEKYPEVVFTYDIIGDGYDNELEKYNHLINKYGLNNYITIHGRIAHSKLTPFFDKCNIGVSYIPVTDYYDHQPPTKTFEYILSGLYCIATNTYANKIVIKKENGILINDNPISFASAMEFIHLNKMKLCDNVIRKTMYEYEWSFLVNNYLKTYLKLW